MHSDATTEIDAQRRRVRRRLACTADGLCSPLFRNKVCRTDRACVGRRSMQTARKCFDDSA
eukprot:2014057-Pleurochrysis_carterae.AAC.1